MSKKGSVVVAVDGSDYSDCVAEEAASLCSAIGAIPVLVSVVKWEVPARVSEGRREELNKQEESEFNELHRRLKEEHFSPKKVVPSSEVLIGDPAKKIVEIADELDAKMIVMGSRGRRRLVTAVLGSVTMSVIERSGCPVLVVKKTG